MTELVLPNDPEELRRALRTWVNGPVAATLAGADRGGAFAATLRRARQQLDGFVVRAPGDDGAAPAADPRLHLPALRGLLVFVQPIILPPERTDRLIAVSWSVEATADGHGTTDADARVMLIDWVHRRGTPFVFPIATHVLPIDGVTDGHVAWPGYGAAHSDARADAVMAAVRAALASIRDAPNDAPPAA